MNARVGRIAAVLLLTTPVVSAAGCATPAPDTSSPAATSTAVAASATTPAVEIVVSSGPITKPLPGDPVRSALMDAARKGLGTSSKFIVYQLHVQDGVAVGDVKPESGTARTFVAWTGGPNAWKMVWTAPFGTADAGAGALRRAVPAASKELGDSLVWTLPLPASNASMLASFKKYAQASVASFAGAYTGGFTYTYKIAKASDGTWYGNCLAQPNQPGLEPIGIYGRNPGGGWSGRVAEFGTENDDATFFPATVLPQLQL